MAELIMGPLIGPLVSIVKEKASSYLLEQYKVMEGMEEQHKILMRKLPAILDVITDAEEQAAEREGARAWLQELKTVAYEANDAFDEFKYEALRRKARKDGHYGKLGVVDTVKLFPSHNRYVFRIRMGNKLRQIVQSIEVLVAEMNAFGFRYHPQPQSSKKWRQTDQKIDDPMKIAERSRAKDIKNVVEILRGQASNPDLTVVPIVGMGGLGKTTLAQLVYNDPDVQKHFQLRLWVCVSDNFDVDSLAKSIVEEATKNKDGSNSPLDSLQKEVSGKTYLLVLDDVWKTRNTFSDKWEKLKTRLQHCGIGSAVLTTTRDERVAQAMGTVEAYNLTALEKNFIEEIIKTRAFSVKEEKPELVKIVDKIVERCVGSPLAATALGSVLRTKTSVKEWEAVLRKSTICDDETGILPILKLSYNYLPSHMKQCFAFCAVFPKDYEIDVDNMIQLWMANGFIPEQKEVPPETMGQLIFSELASRSFFQDVKDVPIDKDKSIHGYCSRITCKIHDLMHDVAQSVMQKECVTIAERPSQTELFPSTARHLLLTCVDQEALLNNSLKKTSPAIQTLLCHGSKVYGSLQHPSKYSSVRALEICTNQSTFLLKPKHLRHLRYLDLSDSRVEALPEDISILYNLQTLNLSGCFCLRHLPRQMKYMNALRHLYTDGCSELKCMPPDLSRLTSLQTLTCFVVGADSDCSNLGELQHLNLCGRLELRQLENVTRAEAKVAKLRNKKELRELTLRWTSEEEQQHNDDMVLELLEPHDGLQALTIDGYRGTTFRMGELRKVVELHLFGCKNLQKLPPLCQLQELQLLSLNGLKKIKFLFSGDSSFTFSKLKELKLKYLPDFKRWMEIVGRQREQIMFPQLEKLSIKSCEKLTALLEARQVPPSCQLPELRLLSLCRLEKLKFLCSGDASFTFPKLKKLVLKDLLDFERWLEMDGRQGGQIMFPQLEQLSIIDCEKLEAMQVSPSCQLPELQLLILSSLKKLKFLCSGDASFTFPKLKELDLWNMPDFEKWLKDGPQREQIMFPQLEKLKIEMCEKLTALTAFPQLKKFWLCGLDSLKSWGMTEGIDGEHSTFPNLENANIRNCPELTSFPQAPKLTELTILGCSNLVYHGGEIELPADLVDGKEKQNHKSPQSIMSLVQLQDLSIVGCDWLVHWPEKEFQSLVSLRTLSIAYCRKLTRYAQPPDQSTSERSQLLPCLESLEIEGCESLVEIFNVASLKRMKISGCPKLELKFRNLVASLERTDQVEQQEESALIQPGTDTMHSTAIERLSPSATELFVPCLEFLQLHGCLELQQEELAVIQPGTDIMHSTAVQRLSPSATELFLPCLESLSLYMCDSISELLNLPSTLTYISIFYCSNIESLSGQLDALQELKIFGCNTLRSLKSCSGELPSLESLELNSCDCLAVIPNKPQSYMSLKALTIRNCRGIKSLPTCLQQQLAHIKEEDKDIDPRIEGPRLSKPKTWKYAISRDWEEEISD